MNDVWYPRPLGFWPLVLATWLFSFSFVLSKVLLFEKEKQIHIHWTPNPMWLCHQSITYKIKYKTTFSKNGWCTHHTKKSCNSFKMWWQCDWKHSNMHVMMSLFGFKILHKCKNIYEKGILNCILCVFLIKNSLDFKKIGNLIMTFPCWFWFGSNFSNV